jgi:hypothetical protein
MSPSFIFKVNFPILDKNKTTTNWISPKSSSLSTVCDLIEQSGLSFYPIALDKKKSSF